MYLSPLIPIPLYLLLQPPPRQAQKKNLVTEAVVCHSHTVYSLIHISLFANTHYNELLIWFQASGFCYTINTRSLLELLLAILLPCVMELLQLWICRINHFSCSSSSQMGWILGQVNSVLDWTWVVAELVSLPALLHPHCQSQPGAAGEVQGPLSRVLQLAERISSPYCCSH